MRTLMVSCLFCHVIPRLIDGHFKAVNGLDDLRGTTFTRLL